MQGRVVRLTVVRTTLLCQHIFYQYNILNAITTFVFGITAANGSFSWAFVSLNDVEVETQDTVFNLAISTDVAGAV